MIWLALDPLRADAVPAVGSRGDRECVIALKKTSVSKLKIPIEPTKPVKPAGHKVGVYGVYGVKEIQTYVK
jgi:hypothetical protein